MIPKRIHFCWLSRDPFPKEIRKCMNTWKEVMPEYEIKLWNTDNFDIEGSPDYVKEAYAMRKWAFAADYIRMYALYNEGGIYLDSDVAVLKSFDCFLKHKFFSSLEYHPKQIELMGAMNMIDDNGVRIKDGYVSGIQIQAAVMGAEKRCPFVGEVLEWYRNRSFIRPDGTPDTDTISPYVYARIAEKYGFVYKDIDQELDEGIKIYRSEIFAGNKHEATAESYAIHNCAHSWHPSMKEKVGAFIKRIFK